MNYNLANRLFLTVLAGGLAVLATSCQKPEQNSSVPQSSLALKPLSLGTTSSNSHFSKVMTDLVDYSKAQFRSRTGIALLDVSHDY